MSISIEEKIKGKNVLFIPIYSARSYETGIYNLALDGNMARIVSKLVTSSFKHATVLIPDKHSGLDVVLKQLDKIGTSGNVDFIECDCYGENAFETRMNGGKFIRFINDMFGAGDEHGIEVVVLEPNTLADNFHELAMSWSAQFIYWCVASITSKGTPWFVEQFAEMDKRIAQRMPTECVLPSQVDALGGYSYCNRDGFYNASAFDYITIFFPFRLSDKSYHAAEFREVINSLPQECKNKIKVLYTDVNDSGIFKEDDVFVKVPSQKEVYIGILKGKPIIPYLDNSNMITHINIHEFMYYGCEVIMWWNTHYLFNDNVTMVDSFSELSKTLERRIKDGK